MLHTVQSCLCNTPRDVSISLLRYSIIIIYVEERKNVSFRSFAALRFSLHSGQIPSRRVIYSELYAEYCVFTGTKKRKKN